MPDDRKWDLRLGYLIHDVSRLRRVSFDRELAPLGITRSQWWVLAFISRNDGLPQTQLANELEVGKVALGSLIDKLEGAGFVKRVPDKEDRRVKRVFLTKMAHQLLSDIAPVSETFNEMILAGVSRKDLETTARTLFKMKKNLLAHANGATDSKEGDLLDIAV
jgi:DNA-binding MarR family transcriptional regulator